MPSNGSDSLSGLTIRFIEERVRLGLSVQEAAEACVVTRNAIGGIQRGAIPSGSVLARFATAGADINFILLGCHRISPAALTKLFGKTLPMQEPLHLLGAVMCVSNANAEYTPDLNPYPASSPHHAGVEIGWRMARAAITGDTTALPGAL